MESEPGCPRRRESAPKQLNRLKMTRRSGRAHRRPHLPRLDGDVALDTCDPDNLDIGMRAPCWTRITTTSRRSRSASSSILAVRKLKNDTKGPILCLVGPPGTGKTSLGRMHRARAGAQVRAALAGRRPRRSRNPRPPPDLHRRAAGTDHPGAAQTRAPTTPSSSSTRSTSSAPTSAATRRRRCSRSSTPEQNNTFRDHYLDVPFDLSKVLFVTTANMLDTIPHALLDRMEASSSPATPRKRSWRSRSATCCRSNSSKTG